MKPLVIYHAHCTDGFGAAYAAWRKFGDNAEYLPVAYGGKPVEFNSDELRQREVYILDFSFDRPVMDALFGTAKRVVWLDHHKTAFEMWCENERELYTSRAPGSDHRIVLDNNKSGALLAWEYFHPDDKVPIIIRHIDDRDRWQFKMRGSKEIHSALASSKPWTFEKWNDLCNPDAYASLWTAGGAILTAQEQDVASMSKCSTQKCTIAFFVGSDEDESRGVVEESGLAANASLHASELGHELANQSGTYGLVWYVGSDGRAKCSLRSNGDYDVSEIAKQFGGGGHKNAAGFEIDVIRLLRWLA